MSLSSRIERVYVFLYAHINDRKEFQPLCIPTFDDIISQLVERGCNVSADVATPNLEEGTLVSLRIVCDGMKAMDIDLSSFVVPK